MNDFGMLRSSLLLAAALLAADVAPIAAQDGQPADARGAAPQGPAPRAAVPRESPPRENARPAAPRAEPVVRSRPEPARAEPPRLAAGSEPGESTAPAAADQGRAVPRGSRPRGDNPPVGVAVPRGRDNPPPIRGDRADTDRDRGRNVVVARPRGIYNNYYYYPRSYYPYGYGAFGLGYFYYDPYRWYPRSYSLYGPGFYGGGFYGNVWRSGRYFDTIYDIGELRLRVTPRQAQVFVDGYYAGVVDDYDGTFQALRMETGPYRIALVAPGYETLEFNVRILPGQKITYRGDLRPQPAP